MRWPIFRGEPESEAPEVWGDDEAPVASLLERYAADSLSPDQATLSRMGAAARAAFVESVMDRETVIGFDEALLDRAPRARRPAWSRRRVGAALLAVAILTLSTVGFATAESGPGQPFYRLRLGFETVNLPPTGSQDRLAADLARADARLTDIAGQAAASNWNGAADAADAYRQVIVSVTLPADPTAKAPAIDRLDGQLARLEQLKASSRAPATASLDGAIAALCKLLGIPVPISDAISVPSARPSTPGRDGGSATANPTGDGRHEGDRSPEPSQADGNGQGGDGGGDGHDGSWPGSQNSGHPDRSPRPSDGQSHWPGSSPQPSPQPSNQPSALPSASSRPSGGY
jgi:predicted N-acetyltransferase YhbS